MEELLEKEYDNSTYGTMFDTSKILNATTGLLGEVLNNTWMEYLQHTNISNASYLQCLDLISEDLAIVTNSSNSTASDCSWICSYNASICTNKTSITTELPITAGEELQFGLFLSITIAVLISFCSLLTLAGNTLVILAFVFERAIRQPSNYFIASLAVSDMLIGCVSMPFFAVYTIMGKWTLGNLACDLWLAADYTVCLISIYTVLLITIDRYCSVKIAARYRSWRTKNKVLVMVSVTWIVPVLVFFVSIMGWDSFQGYRDLKPDECEVQFLKNKIFNTALIFGYFYSSLTVMLILYAGIYKTARDMHKKTAAKQKKIQMMVSMNKSNAKLCIGLSKTQSTLLSQDKPNPMSGGTNQNTKTDQLNNSKSSKNNTMDSERQDGSDQDRSSSPIMDSDEEIKIEYHKTKSKDQPKSLPNTKSSAGNKSSKEAKSSSANSKYVPAESKKTKRRSVAPPDQNQKSLLDTDNIMAKFEGKEDPINRNERTTVPPSTLNVKPMVTFEGNSLSAHEQSTVTIPESNTMTYIDQDALGGIITSPVDVHADKLSNEANFNLKSSQGSSSATKNNADLMAKDKVETELKATSTGQKYETQVIKPTESSPITRTNTEYRQSSHRNSSQLKREVAASMGKKNKRRKKKSDVEKRQTSKSENRARKALRTISFIMGAFALCWTPYHILALIEGFCTIKRCTNYHLFYFSYFLCYANSPLNPFCYALANQQFKKTFARILKGNFHRT